MNMLRKGSLIVFMIVWFGFGSAAYAMPFYFDTGNQGWQQCYIGKLEGATYDKLFELESADWKETGGNPGGHIYQTAGGIDERAYYLGFGEANYFGDLTGKKLITDIWSTNNWRTVADGAFADDGNVYARWVIAKQDGTASDGKPLYNMYVSRRSVSIDINSLSGWETHSILVKEENFFRWPNYDAGTQDFSSLLTDYDSIGLYLFSGSDDLSNYNGGTGTWYKDNDYYRLLHYGAYSRDGQEATWALDNFRAEPVPEPATLVLLGMGLILAGIGARRTLKG